MTLKLKVAIVASTAAVVCGALAAVAAGAVVSGETYPLDLHGEQSGNHAFRFTDAGDVLAECETVTFVGSIASPTSTFILTPTYDKCKMGGFSATVEPSGCNYRYHVGSTIELSGKFDGSLDVQCPFGKQIKLVTTTCEVEIGPIEGLITTEFINMGIPAQDFTITHKIEKAAYVVTKDGLFCPFSGTGSFTQGDYTGSSTIRGSQKGIPWKVSVHHP